MSNITPFTPTTIEEGITLSKTLQLSKVFPKYQNPEAIFAIIAAGRELGLPPMQALRSLHFYEGHVSMSSDLMVALCLQHEKCEYLRLVRSNGSECVYEAKRRGHPSPVTVTWTIQMAKDAGLTKKDNWSKYPQSMLRARCGAEICRAVFPDLMMGCYDSDSGELNEPAAAQAPTATVVIDAVFEPVATDPLPTPKEPQPVLTLEQKLSLSSYKASISRASTTADLDKLCTTASNDKSLEGAPMVKFLEMMNEGRRRLVGA